MTLAASILGFVTMFQLRANAPGLRFRDWLAGIGALAVLGGLVLALVADPLMGALRGPFFQLWPALAAEVAVAALFCSTMIVAIGRWAIIPTWLTFIVLGNTSSGGAVAQPLLPPFYAFMGRFLPPGATVSIVPHRRLLPPVAAPGAIHRSGRVAGLYARRPAHLRPPFPADPGPGQLRLTPLAVAPRPFGAGHGGQWITRKRASAKRPEAAQRQKYAYGENQANEPQPKRERGPRGGLGGSPPRLTATRAAGAVVRRTTSTDIRIAWGYVDLNHGPLPYQGADLAAQEAIVSL
jgi:hypothetical protein